MEIEGREGSSHDLSLNRLVGWPGRGMAESGRGMHWQQNKHSSSTEQKLLISATAGGEKKEKQLKPELLAFVVGCCVLDLAMPFAPTFFPLTPFHSAACCMDLNSAKFGFKYVG